MGRLHSSWFLMSSQLRKRGEKKGGDAGDGGRSGEASGDKKEDKSMRMVALEEEVARDLKQRLIRRHELVFVFSCVNIWATAYMLGAAPTKYYLWHSAKALFLLTTRVYSFLWGEKNYSMLLLDLCYFVNILLLAYLWVFPSSTWLFRALFALSTGPLAWSVAMFRNSLVLSSISHATSLWLHLSPPLLMWGIRWYAVGDLDSPFVVCETDSCSITEFWHSRGTLVMFGPVIGLYALWLAIHYTVIFIIMWDEIQEKKLYTLYSSSSLQWIVEKGGHQEWKRQLVYFASHAVFALSGCAISMIMWSNFYLHTAYLIIVMLISAYNGATYYMIVFARKYNSEIERRAERKARVQLDTVHMM